MEKTKFQVVSKEEGLITIPKKRYKKLKIEKLGNDAFKLILDSLKKGRTHTEIAKTLSEVYEKNITQRDVTGILTQNSGLMADYRLFLLNSNIEKANMILDHSTVFVERMEDLNSLAEKLQDKVKHTTSTKEITELVKSTTDITRTSSTLIKDFKKLTGQFKEGPSIVIDQSKKEVNINVDNDKSDKLAKELARASFKSDSQIRNEPKVVTVESKEVEVD